MPSFIGEVSHLPNPVLGAVVKGIFAPVPTSFDESPRAPAMAT
jgi:hypothetical protein